MFISSLFLLVAYLFFLYRLHINTPRLASLRPGNRGPFPTFSFLSRAFSLPADKTTNLSLLCRQIVFRTCGLSLACALLANVRPRRRSRPHRRRLQLARIYAFSPIRERGLYSFKPSILLFRTHT